METKRVLQLVDGDVVEPAGDNFVMQEMLFVQILANVRSRERGFVTDNEVSASDASALAFAIGQIPASQGWRIGLYFAGESEGDGLRDFCRFLNRGGFTV